MSIVDSKINNLSCANKAWYQFVLDHLDEIKKNATTHYFTEADVSNYRSRMNKFYANFGLPTSTTWIAHILNNTGMLGTPVANSLVFVPKLTHLNNLYRLHSTAVEGTT